MKRFIWIPVAILGIVSAIVGCKKSADQDLASRKDYTPEDIYRGIILGDGEVATQIPELSKNKSVVGTISEEQKKKNAQAEDQIISFVNSNFPGFLQEFKTEILSRDAIRIDNALKKASDITLKAVFLTKVSKFAKNETEGKKIIYAALQKNPLKFNTLMHDLRNKRIQDKSEIERRVTEIFDLHSSNVKILGNNFARTAEDDGEGDGDGDDCLAINLGMVINVVAVINGALLTNLAVAVNVETMVNIDFEVSDITQADGLSREKLVASIAQNI